VRSSSCKKLHTAGPECENSQPNFCGHLHQHRIFIVSFLLDFLHTLALCRVMLA